VSLLRTENLLKLFGDYHAVNKVNFTVEQGEVLALVGSNGAGKTTLVNVITGYYFPEGGSIHFKGVDMTRATVNERVQAGIARSFQLVNLFDQMTAFDNIALPVFSRQRKTRNFLMPAVGDSAVRDETQELLEQFGLATKGSVPAGGLAQGERKLLDVAAAYALRPGLLFLDEPTSGVSTRDKAKIMDIVSGVVRSGHISAVIIEHDMDVVFRYSDRIVMMHEGKILADGKPDEIRNNEEVAMTLIGGKFTN
jgi:branched-chain amino acid transport system ATP-binding protein